MCIRDSACRAQLAGAGLAQHPAHRVRKVRLAGAVGTYHASNCLLYTSSVKLAEATGADCVQVIGSKFVLYLQKKRTAPTLIC